MTTGKAMQSQASFGRRGAPASMAKAAPGPWTPAPAPAPDDIEPEDSDLQDNPLRRLVPAEERAFGPQQWAVLAAIAVLALGGTGVIFLAMARQSAAPAAHATARLNPADQSSR
jgi:hypothetical protein